MTQTKDRTRVEYWFALSSVHGLGSVRINRLVAHFGDVANIFDATLPDIIQVPSFSTVLATRILTVSRNLERFREQLQTLNSRNIEILCPEDDAYPTALKTIPDAPAILCRAGKLTDVGERCVAIIGTRRPTQAGIELTLELTAYLALAGFTIVSGLAEGIDAYAHSAALTVEGKTVAVLATALSPNSLYPRQNRELGEKIRDTGCLLSEYPFPIPPSPGNLVIRGRIISGLSLATIVIETGKTGGTMHTARYAFRQGRPVFACRWDSSHEMSEGAQELINRGAHPFLPSDIDNVVETLTNPALLEKKNADTPSKQMALFD